MSNTPKFKDVDLEDFSRIICKSSVDNLKTVIYSQEGAISLAVYEEVEVDGILKDQLINAITITKDWCEFYSEKDKEDARGFVGAYDYSKNATDLDYVQKNYVDGLRGQLEHKTTAELLSIAEPKLGKQYFNLDNNLICYHNGSDWKKIASESL